MVGRMKKLVFLLAVACSSFVYGQQDLSNFKTLKSDGLIPEEFIKRSSQKYREDLAQNQDKDLDKNFFLSTRFMIDEILLSGQVLFNEDLSNYVNKVAKYTLRSQKKLYNELQFYVLKSSVVNAFSTDQGIIIFTTGLLAQLENEAQLAYVIAHEVSHYVEHHVRDSYVEEKTFNKGQGRYQRMDYESKVSQLSIYEKSNEFEADEKGIEIYLKTEYAVDEIFSSFEMLLYSYLPFDEVRFDSAFFNTNELVVPGVFFPDTIREITREEDYDDENSSHPNIKKRMDAAFDKVGDKSSRGDLKFKVSEEDFYKVRNLARFEGVNIALSEREYGRALYDIFLLKREFSENRFLDLSMVKALYGLAKYKNANRYREVTERPKEIEGESYRLHTFLYNLSRDQINVIAFRHAYDMAMKYKTDRVFQLYYEDMKKELALRSRMDYKELKDMPFDAYMASLNDKQTAFDVQDSIAKVDASDLSKYQKIRLKKKLRAIEEGVENPDAVENEFYVFGLYDIVKEGLIADLDRIRLDEEKEDENEADGVEPVSKIVIVDPLYADFNVKSKRNYEKSEDKKINVANAYTRSYSKLNLEVDIIDSKNLGKENVEKYNELGLVFNWFSELADHEDLEMISSMHDLMDDVTNRYGTDHFLFTGIYAYKDRNEPNVNHFWGVLSVYGIPFVIADLLIIHNYFDMVTFSINASTDQIELTQVNEVNLKGTNKTIEAYIYDVLYQVKHGTIKEGN